MRVRPEGNARDFDESADEQLHPSAHAGSVCELPCLSRIPRRTSSIGRDFCAPAVSLLRLVLTSTSRYALIHEE